MQISAVRLGIIAAVVVGAVAIGSAVLPGARADNGSEKNGGEKGLVGAWEAVATFSNPPMGFPPAAQLTETYFEDGNLLLMPNLPGVTSAQGSYERVASNTFNYTANFYAANPQGGLLAKSRIVGHLVLSNGDSEYTTAAKLETLDANNHVTSTLSATVRGKRLAIVTN